jgi:hypothetical protein
VEAPGGIKAQEERIKRFSHLHNYKLVKLFKGEGVSVIDERPQFEKMMRAKGSRPDRLAYAVYKKKRSPDKTSTLKDIYRVLA